MTRQTRVVRLIGPLRRSGKSTSAAWNCYSKWHDLKTLRSPSSSGHSGAIWKPSLWASVPRAAQRGFLLVDLEFGNPVWWRRVGKSAVNKPRAERRTPAFPRIGGQQLARSTLFLAWHAVRSEPAAASVMLGLSAEVQSEIARLSLHDIDCIAVKRHADLRPRWETEPQLWRQLLRAAQSGDYRIARAVNIRGLQLITGAVTNRETESR